MRQKIGYRFLLNRLIIFHSSSFRLIMKDQAITLATDIIAFAGAVTIDELRRLPTRPH